MRLSTTGIIAVALLCGCAAPPAATTVQAQNYQCATASHDEAFALHGYLVEIVTGSDSASFEDRALYQLPTAQANKVAYLTRANDCRTAALRFYTAMGMTPPTSGTVVVIAIKVASSRYVVSVPGIQAGEFTPVLTFDSKWNLLANVVS
jgi:hypothetical protein